GIPTPALSQRDRQFGVRGFVKERPRLQLSLAKTEGIEDSSLFDVKPNNFQHMDFLLAAFFQSRAEERIRNASVVSKNLQIDQANALEAECRVILPVEDGITHDLRMLFMNKNPDAILLLSEPEVPIELPRVTRGEKGLIVFAL